MVLTKRSTRIVSKAIIWWPAEAVLLPMQDAKRATSQGLFQVLPNVSNVRVPSEDLECTLEETDTQSRWVDLG